MSAHSRNSAEGPLPTETATRLDTDSGCLGSVAYIVWTLRKPFMQSWSMWLAPNIHIHAAHLPNKLMKFAARSWMSAHSRNSAEGPLPTETATRLDTDSGCLGSVAYIVWTLRKPFMQSWSMWLAPNIHIHAAHLPNKLMKFAARSWMSAHSRNSAEGPLPTETATRLDTDSGCLGSVAYIVWTLRKPFMESWSMWLAPNIHIHACHVPTKTYIHFPLTEPSIAPPKCQRTNCSRAIHPLFWYKSHHRPYIPYICVKTVMLGTFEVQAQTPEIPNTQRETRPHPPRRRKSEASSLGEIGAYSSTHGLQVPGIPMSRILSPRPSQEWPCYL